MTRPLRQRRSGTEVTPGSGKRLPLYPANRHKGVNAPDRHFSLGSRHDAAIEEDR